MRLDKLSISAQEAFQAAMGVAGDAEASIIEPIHMLKAVLDASENNLEAILKRIGADPAALRRNVFCCQHCICSCTLRLGQAGFPPVRAVSRAGV